MKKTIKFAVFALISTVLAGCTCYTTHVPRRRINHGVAVAPAPVVVAPAPVVVAPPPPPKRVIVVNKHRGVKPVPPRHVPAKRSTPPRHVPAKRNTPPRSNNVKRNNAPRYNSGKPAPVKPGSKVTPKRPAAASSPAAAPNTARPWGGR